METTREKAMEWWNLLSTKGKSIVVSTEHSRSYESLTGREIEAIWQHRGCPSSSMDIRKLSGEELVGRFVRITDEYNRITFGTVTSFTKSYFRVDEKPALYKVGSGKMRGSDTWRSTYCNLVAPEEANRQIEKQKAELYRKKTIESIIHEVNSGRCTNEQLEAACLALGLVKV